ncbi:ABC transporter permease [Bernardetia sp.]|uniref:ABC transporter permease n=1 Tax=Bernardetia sp. TaxID=1937974 RepID=UPI0025BF0B23|nr:ABC transporter permease [Bernardetia sp.]
MNKIRIIIEREYLTRVRKKSFIIMSLIAPFLVIALMVIPAWLTSLDTGQKVIQVVDEGNLLERLSEIDNVKLDYPIQNNIEEAKENLKEKSKEFDGLLLIPRNVTAENTDGILLFADKNIPIQLEKKIERQIAKKLEERKLVQLGMNPVLIKEAKTKVTLTVTPLYSKESRTDSTVASIVAYLSAVMIYFFIFLYGAQVMRGVMEEKTNRIVEVIISSVKPFQLMLGKIIGVACVAFTQFLIWIVLGLVLFFTVSSIFSLENNMTPEEAQAIVAQSGGMASNLETDLAVQNILETVQTLNFPLIIGAFGFYFIMGYLVYGALYGAVGSIVDNQTDTQQFMLPITIPLITAIGIIGLVVNDPDGTVAFWASMFPLTSPLIMMVRIPFEPPLWEVAVSMLTLFFTFLGITWLVGRIYRIGILMYGKKPTYKEVSKWLFYKA